MIRVVLAVAVGAALLAVSVPAMETVRVSHADARVAGAVDRVETAARSLVERNDAVAESAVGARRVLTLDLPRGTWGTAALEHLAVRPHPLDNRTVVQWRVEGGGTTERRLDAVQIEPVGDGFARWAGGRLRVRLVLLQRGGDRVVRIGPAAARSGAT
ncbi:MAG: hypothetical protein V5A43_01750 [Haloarculaceae archaeon]